MTMNNYLRKILLTLALTFSLISAGEKEEKTERSSMRYSISASSQAELNANILNFITSGKSDCSSLTITLAIPAIGNFQQVFTLPIRSAETHIENLVIEATEQLNDYSESFASIYLIDFLEAESKKASPTLKSLQLKSISTFNDPANLKSLSAVLSKILSIESLTIHQSHSISDFDIQDLHLCPNLEHLEVFQNELHYILPKVRKVSTANFFKQCSNLKSAILAGSDDPLPSLQNHHKLERFEFVSLNPLIDEESEITPEFLCTLPENLTKLFLYSLKFSLDETFCMDFLKTLIKIPMLNSEARKSFHIYTCFPNKNQHAPLTFTMFQELIKSHEEFADYELLNKEDSYFINCKNPDGRAYNLEISLEKGQDGTAVKTMSYSVNALYFWHLPENSAIAK